LSKIPKLSQHGKWGLPFFQSFPNHINPVFLSKFPELNFMIFQKRKSWSIIQPKMAAKIHSAKLRTSITSTLSYTILQIITLR